MTSVSTPNTRVTATGAIVGNVTVPAGSTVAQVLSSMGVANPVDYLVVGPRGKLELTDQINEDAALTVTRK